MSQIPTSPASRLGSEAPEMEGKPAGTAQLLQSLDTLLEQYLHLLDRQQQLQSGLSKQLSSGFLALAHANYTCPPGRRYGVDYYDERMKATRKITIRSRQEVDQDEPPKATKDQVEAEKSSAPGYEYNFCLSAPAPRRSEEKTDAKEETGELFDSPPDAESSQPEESTPTTSEKQPVASTDVGVSGSAPEASKTTSKKFRSDDPIHWYGILVPPSLRTAQTSFTDAVQDQVPELAGVTIEMSVVEDRITQLRKKLETQPTEESTPQ